MKLSQEIKEFIQKHLHDDTNQLLLSAARYPEIDVPFAVDQIIARQRIKEKLPEWYILEDLLFPSRLSTEQCSSEWTARYKAQLLLGERFCDLTGGLGVDCFYFSKQAKEAIYVERFADYCNVAKHNFNLLKASNIQVIHRDARELLSSLQVDTFYLDPARRSKDNKRAFALSDCEPDLLQLKPLLLERAKRTIVKISPMADLEETLRLLPETTEIHIIAVKNECKELLFVLENREKNLPLSAVKVHAVNLSPKQKENCFIFTLQEEKSAPLHVAENVENFLYEPHAALLKSGAFKLIASRYGLKKLHYHTHLYTSKQLVESFPGRSFRVEQQFEFSKKLLQQISIQFPKANLTIRNFPLSVAEFRKRSKLKEGGDCYLFATTLANEQKIVLQTSLISTSKPNVPLLDTQT